MRRGAPGCWSHRASAKSYLSPAEAKHRQGLDSIVALTIGGTADFGGSLSTLAQKSTNVLLGTGSGMRVESFSVIGCSTSTQEMLGPGNISGASNIFECPFEWPQVGCHKSPYTAWCGAQAGQQGPVGKSGHLPFEVLRYSDRTPAWVLRTIKEGFPL